MKFLDVFLLGLFVVGNAECVQYLSEDVYGGSVSCETDMVIVNGTVFMPGRLEVLKSINIENNGRVETYINVCDRCDVFVKNSGDFSASVNLGNAARLYQVIDSPDSLNAVDVNTDYSVVVDNVNGIALHDVFDVTRGANQFYINDSIINLNGITDTVDENVALNGCIKFVRDSLDDFYNIALFSNVSGDAQISFETDDNDVMFVNVGRVVDGKLFVMRERETDYLKIMNNSSGRFLNNLRLSNPDDALLIHADAAENISQLNDVLNMSARFNPDILLSVLRIVRGFDFGYMGTENKLMLRPNYISSDDFYAYGFSADVLTNLYDRFAVWFDAYMYTIDWTSDLDDFSAWGYGFDFGARYLFENNIYIESEIGIARFDFNIDAVLYDGVILENPSILNTEFYIETGYKYNLLGSAYILPFVAGDLNVYKFAEGKTCVEVQPHVGVGTEYQTEILGINYNLGLWADVNSDFAVTVSGRAGFWSKYDAAGADINLSVTNMLNAISYQVSIGANVWF